MTGIICLNKPEEITSFFAVKKTGRLVGEKKAGHAGTLDPLATGVLPILLGGATRFLEFLPTSPKRYVAVFRLGITTDTLDITGNILAEKPVHCGKEDILAALPSFRGDILQVPPMYSAIKKDGVRMYDLARQGIEVEREARPVTIFELELRTEEEAKATGAQLTPPKENEYILEVQCSSGTYIRTLIDDLGKALGCGATMTQLVRTEVGNLSLKQAVSFEELDKAATEGTLEDILTPVPDALSHLTAVSISKAQAKRFSNGGELDLNRIPYFRGRYVAEDGTLFLVNDPEGRFLGLGQLDLVQHLLTVKRVFVSR